eukprot:s492_g1.t1
MGLFRLERLRAASVLVSYRGARLDGTESSFTRTTLCERCATSPQSLSRSRRVARTRCFRLQRTKRSPSVSKGQTWRSSSRRLWKQPKKLRTTAP